MVPVGAGTAQRAWQIPQYISRGCAVKDDLVGAGG